MDDRDCFVTCVPRNDKEGVLAMTEEGGNDQKGNDVTNHVNEYVVLIFKIDYSIIKSRMLNPQKF